MASNNLNVNLPSTPFPMEGKMLQGKQDEIMQLWQAMDIYRTILEDRRDAQPFILHDGPPFTSGEMNIGVGFNKTLKDIVAKFQTMNGKRVPFVPGWDCHGLPIESDVLEEAKKQHTELSPSEIRDRCATNAGKYIRSQKEQFQRLGVFADWDRPYQTMAANYEATVLETLSEIVEKGYVYRDRGPTNWCSRCESVLADAEIENVDGKDSCVRCGAIVEIKKMLQWFVRVDHIEQGLTKTLRQRALDELETIRWFPVNSRTRIHNMIKERPDWRISRQRFWGVPIPSFHCLDCGNDILDPKIIRHIRDMVSPDGSDVWFSSTAAALLPSGYTCDRCSGARLEKGIDILDGWFESGTSWRAVLIADHRLHRPEFSADLCIEGNDQHRGWFQMSLLTSVIVKNRAPFTALLTHGFVLNSKRRRMSRLQGDYVSLRTALEHVPVDLIRLYFVWNKNYDQDIPLSIPAMLELEPVYRTFRNCFRYLLGNLNDYIPQEHNIPLVQLEGIDQWIICKLHRLINEVTSRFENYQFKEAVESISNFCQNDLNRIYFEIVKDRLYNEAAQSLARRKAQTAMHSVLVALGKMLAPVLVYTSEEAWQLCPGHLDCASVHLSLWPKSSGGLMNSLPKAEALEEKFGHLLQLRSALQPQFENARHNKLIGETIDATVVLFATPQSLLSNSYLHEHLQAIRDVLCVSELAVAARSEGLTPLSEFPGIYFSIVKCSHSYCMRCRRYDESVGSDQENPAFCHRCIAANKEQQSVIPQKQAFNITEYTSPVEISKYLKARDIRRVAILRDEAGCRAYYFHFPSHSVKPDAALQPLADFVVQHLDFKQHSAILLGLGEHTDVLFGIGIHQLIHGTPLGGTREFSYSSIGELIENLLRLSYGMSVKNAIGQLPYGGGKSIIDTCGHDFKVHREFRRHVYRDFGQFTASLYGRYICAEDMNNTNADTREMLAFCRHVMCLPESVGGSGNPSRFTALVAWLAARAGWKFLTGKDSLEGAVVAIQGIGNVGAILVEILAEGEPGIKKILVADTVDEQINTATRKLHRRGKASLLERRNAYDPGSHQSRSNNQESLDTYILYSDCDILIPVAVGKVINPENVDCLNCKLIVPIANNVYSNNDLVAQKLFDAGIVDVVENNVNWGGATAAASELLGYDEDNLIDWCYRKVYSETLALLEEAKQKALPPWEIIKQLATENMQKAHPIVAESRKYEFIGDVSKDFQAWIKEKWLPKQYSIDPDLFAAEVVKRARD